MKFFVGLMFLVAYTPYGVSFRVLAAKSSTSSALAAKSIVTATASATTSVFSDITIHLIRCSCNMLYEPVCGSNRVTYSNECMLRCVSNYYSNNSGSHVHLLHRGQCHNLSCDCPQTVESVCGSNNQTYRNDCYRICDNTYCTDHKLLPIKLAYKDVCKPTQCFCPDAIIPVCGTDKTLQSKTYRNICHLQYCSQANLARGLPGIEEVRAGECQNEACSCTLIEKQICASDGKSYFNKCAMDCLNRKRDQIGLEPIIYQYPGECKKCICMAKFDPVCGSDGETYANHCLLLCKNRILQRRLPELTVHWRGPCNCGCIKQHMPICASDRATWGNRCLLDCENRRRVLNGQPRLTVHYEGECQLCNCEFCPKRDSPVCGSDNQTYQSRCFLNCTNNCHLNYGMLPIWEIADTECYR